MKRVVGSLAFLWVAQVGFAQPDFSAVENALHPAESERKKFDEPTIADETHVDVEVSESHVNVEVTQQVDDEVELATPPRRSLNGFVMGFDVMAGIDRYRGAHRNGALRVGFRLRPVAALGFDIGFGIAFLGHEVEDVRLNGLEGSVHVDMRTYFNAGAPTQPFLVGGLRYGRFFATNAESECPSVHSSSPSEPTISVSMSFYDLSGGAGFEFQLNENVAVVWDVRGVRRTGVRGDREFQRDSVNGETTSRSMFGWSTYLGLVATASTPAPEPPKKANGWW